MASCEFDFVETLAAQHTSVLEAVNAQGGVDLDVLLEPKQGNQGNRIDFFSLTDMVFEDVPLGFKRYRPGVRFGYYQTVEGYTLDIATLALMGQLSGKSAEMLPRVHYEITDSQENPLGVLTEDFSRHGKLYFSNSTLLPTFPSILSNPDAVDSDHLDHVVGVFESYQDAASKEVVRKIMDVSPLYDTDIILDEHSQYVDWFEEDLAIHSVAARIRHCRISEAEIRG